MFVILHIIGLSTSALANRNLSSLFFPHNIQRSSVTDEKSSQSTDEDSLVSPKDDTSSKSGESISEIPSTGNSEGAERVPKPESGEELQKNLSDLLLKEEQLLLNLSELHKTKNESIYTDTFLVLVGGSFIGLSQLQYSAMNIKYDEASRISDPNKGNEFNSLINDGDECKLSGTKLFIGGSLVGGLWVYHYLFITKKYVNKVLQTERKLEDVKSNITDIQTKIEYNSEHVKDNLQPKDIENSAANSKDAIPLETENIEQDVADDVNTTDGNEEVRTDEK